MDIQEQLRSALKEIDRIKKENIQLKRDLHKAQGRNTSYSRTSNIKKTATDLTPKEKAATLLFMNLFRGKTYVFAQRWESNTTGKSGYSPACENKWDKELCQKPKIKCQDCSHQLFHTLTPQAIYEHLSGIKTVGIYPLLEDNTGRLHRDHSDKEEVKVFDYVDSNIDVLQKIFEKRLKGYKNIGYSLYGENKEKSQQIQLF
ncbi:TOTE conflict system archaeo-eukaryotic primase domain-containing protein [Aquibacillus salsiterrae]|uniref:TOTE conflict system primase domain-containing protein n=1 Tax=Aquibacillus salsiterrae TaxID=2950439 RepID=A0A9X3WHR8_9BACI|nr:hypothetical protein [Aquibacillus salsiterrae]MDC3418695.1 hypothetical protein [Aquibacillus salsiterrae]